jgi:hypothetical protein
MRTKGVLVSLTSLSAGKVGAYFQITTSTNCVQHRSQHSLSYSFYAVIRSQDQNLRQTLNSVVSRRLQNIAVDSRCRYWAPSAESLQFDFAS